MEGTRDDEGEEGDEEPLQDLRAAGRQARDLPAGESASPARGTLCRLSAAAAATEPAQRAVPTAA